MLSEASRATSWRMPDDRTSRPLPGNQRWWLTQGRTAGAQACVVMVVIPDSCLVVRGSDRRPIDPQRASIGRRSGNAAGLSAAAAGGGDSAARHGQPVEV